MRLNYEELTDDWAPPGDGYYVMGEPGEDELFLIEWLEKGEQCDEYQYYPYVAGPLDEDTLHQLVEHLKGNDSTLPRSCS